MELTAAELRALLRAYYLVLDSVWPSVHPSLRERAATWGTDAPAVLGLHLQDLLQETEASTQPLRVFWKLGPTFAFGGCNAAFATDARLPRDQVIGITDYDPRLPWARQAAKYRQDDKAIAETGKPNLDILERHTAPDGGISWVRAAKAPLQTEDGRVFGLFGAYEPLASEEGRRLFAEQQARLRTS